MAFAVVTAMQADGLERGEGYHPPRRLAFRLAGFASPHSPADDPAQSRDQTLVPGWRARQGRASSS